MTDTDPRFSVLGARPGKIVAVHLAYASRADQRGRRPAAPSYFFKPSSSLAPSGAEIVRPAGTELLAFEGEIALVIGEPARWVTPDAAWSHVASLTAANDFGLYDLRPNDKGSNVRSKGGDGFTPLGPALIDARNVDPAALRLRTWVDGELVQDDSTADLLFPLAQIVADLSQHFTLETGDVILTGTPAGSSVVTPGQVVEVQVDAGTLSTGRLRTTVVQGDRAFDAAIGSLPAVDDTQRAEAWGSVEAAAAGAAGARTGDRAETGRSTTERPVLTASPVPATDSPAPHLAPRTGDHAGTGRPAATPPVATGSPVPARDAPASLSPDLRAKLARIPVAALSGQLRKRGLNDVTIDGVHALTPGSRFVGTARTLRFVPHREDLFAAHGGGQNAQKRAFDAVEEGEVIVIEARGERGSGTLGDILALRAHARGASAIVTDGGVRDAEAVAAVGIPVFTAGPHPAVLGRRHVPWETDVAVGCGGTTVEPGDILVGDGDGVIVIPPALAEEVADAALAQEEEDAWIARQVASGHPVEGLFPMNAEWRARFESERNA
ncbi:fumarylacetoacetate hydrolase family protein [Microbacterium trichothecenolyticum]|uniref:5-oxopent-3-ene-1,2,5-tricarboxylate decarboxylase/2-hydroxyhepta-2,4-diene-1,7-dioate isomerase n=1 Tax=Microbacterium trichothecenolyticum TaxID=69370 RepID=A0ABU0TTQ8_MICTR|nr:fumarylacetoacetate hydrolase family protein [Microbacterium trichothecenolyticum]MDQ1123046.1 5-oxopent-3-ene-1,2,5-tricarboxylate decarboxylase/2-hydroxyhepta-2,4-diene-1,7-dioate isomerase [Microbacterium trichothecenolyticum]